MTHFPVTLAIVSDLHVGENNRVAELRPRTSPASRLVRFPYLEQLFKMAEEECLRPECLVIAGDIADSADRAEVALASEAIEAMARRLGIADSSIVFAPGNHDKDWDAPDSPHNPGYRVKQAYSPLRDIGWYIPQIMMAGHQGLLENEYFSSWNLEHVFALAYNSSWHDGRDAATEHFGCVDKDHLESIAEHLGAIRSSIGDKLKVFVMHHHPMQYSEPDGSRDPSIAVNSDNLFSLLFDHGFDLVIHGHKHHPYLRYAPPGRAGKTIPIVCAGSLAARIPPELSGGLNNQFHALHVEGRDGATGQVYGQLSSWSYHPSRGWIPSHGITTGIDGSRRFGVLRPCADVAEWISPLVARAFATREYIEWRAIEASDSRLSNLDPDVVSEALTLLEKNGVLVLHESIEKDILLLRSTP